MTDQTTALTSILVSPEVQAETRGEHTQAQETLAALRAWPCETPADESALAEILQAIKGKWKVLEDKRTTVTKPLNAAKRAVDALFKPALDALADAETIIKTKLAEAQSRRLEANARAMEAAKAAGMAGNSQGAGQALAALDLTKAPAGTHYRYTWDFTVEDLDQVPREWLSVDHSKVRIYLRQFQNSEVIPDPARVPGLRFFRDATVVSRSG